MHRHKGLSLCKPKSTSLARATEFNKATFSKFFFNVCNILRTNILGPEAVFKIDETCVTTSHKPGKVIAFKCENQVAQPEFKMKGKTLLIVCCGLFAVGMLVHFS